MTEHSAALESLREWQARVKLGGNHRYTADGKYAPGTTTIIKTMDAPALDKWKVRMQAEGTARAAFGNPPMESEPEGAYIARMRRLAEGQFEADRLADEAAKIGTDVHALIEAEIRRMLGHPTAAPVVCEEALYRFSGWKQWAKDVQFTPLITEARVYHSGYDYCGTVDVLATVEGKLAQEDWKPTDVVWPERRLQSAAYRKALVSMGFPEMRGGIVCLPRDGGDIKMIETDPPGPELEATYEAFLALLNVYRWQKDLERAVRAAARA